MTAPRDWRWADAPRPDPDTGRVPLAPTPAAADVPALLAEADAFCAEWERASLRVALVADQSLVIRRLLDRCDAQAEALRRADELHKLDAFMVHTADRARDEARRDQLAAVAERDDARRDRDGLASRIQGMVAIGHGARYRLTPESDAGEPPP